MPKALPVVIATGFYFFVGGRSIPSKTAYPHPPGVTGRLPASARVIANHTARGLSKEAIEPKAILVDTRQSDLPSLFGNGLYL